MARLVALFLWAILLVAAAVQPPDAASQADSARPTCLDPGVWTKNFGYVGPDGESRSCVVPPGVTEIMVEAWGGAGSGIPTVEGVRLAGGEGGDGGYGRQVVTVTPGQVLYFAVGQAGNHSRPFIGGYAGGGGGASWVATVDHWQLIDTDPSRLIAVGGGGGGGGICLYGHGGDGGAGQGNYGHGIGNPGRDGALSCGHGGSGGGLGEGGAANAPAECTCDGQYGLYGRGGGFKYGEQWGGWSGPFGNGRGGDPILERGTVVGKNALISGGGGGGYGGGAAGWEGAGGGGGGSYPAGPFGRIRWNDQGDGIVSFSYIEMPPGRCTVQGTPEDDELYGTPHGEETICGGGGNDVIHAEEGHDTLYGGSGRDILLGGQGRDKLHGNGGHDRLVGGAHDDTLFGNGDSDAVNGGPGDDSCAGPGSGQQDC